MQSYEEKIKKIKNELIDDFKSHMDGKIIQNLEKNDIYKAIDFCEQKMSNLEDNFDDNLRKLYWTTLKLSLAKNI